MVDGKQITPAEVLGIARRRRPLCASVQVDTPVTARQVLAAFEVKMQQRQDLGVAKRALNIVLEPRNPFEPDRRRKPKMETVLFGALLALVLTALLFFNLAAPRIQVQS